MSDAETRPALEYDVVIVHYRDPQGVLRLVREVAGQSIPPRCVIVVDNSAGDCPLSIPDGLPVPVHVLASPSNPGYGAAMNMGVGASAYLPGGDSAFVLLLTQDVRLERMTIESLFETAQASGAACVAPVLRYSSDPSRIYSSGGTISRCGRIGHRRDEMAHHKYRIVDWADGAVLLVRRDTFSSAGGFWQGYFLYFEDVELCVRIREMGGIVVVSGSGVAQQEPGNYTPYLRIRNQVLFERRNLALPAWFLALRGLAQALRTSVGLVLRGRPCEIAEPWAGLTDGLSGKAGRRGA